MTETVDVQGTVIGVGGLLALVLILYGSFVSETVFGLESMAAATWVFVGTFLAVAVVHGTYGRFDLALAHAGAGIGLAAVLLATSVIHVLGGLAILLVLGSYIAIVSIRAR